MKAHEVLENVIKLIASREQFKARYGYSQKLRICDVYDSIGIFDWWNDFLSVSQLKQMKQFLETAISLGYTGYACFKVGAAGCSHGMWAHKLDSNDGYSPKDDGCLFHSFRNGDNYYDLRLDDGSWIGTDEKRQFTLKEIKNVLGK